MTKDVSAPGALELVRQFVNSLDLDHPERDPFLTSASANGWLDEHGFDGISLEAGDMPKVRDLREALRMELLSHAGEEAAGSWTRLATLLHGAGLELVFDPREGMRLEASAEAGFPAIRGAIASRIYDAVRSEQWRRLKACRKETCLFAFYDRSKNGSGTWCDMAVCGNRVKAERRRARERTGAGHRHKASD